MHTSHKLQSDLVYFLQLLDSNHDNMINFRDFVVGLGIQCRADLPARLLLMYRLHLPPALLAADLEEYDIHVPKSGMFYLTVYFYFCAPKSSSNRLQDNQPVAGLK